MEGPAERERRAVERDETTIRWAPARWQSSRGASRTEEHGEQLQGLGNEEREVGVLGTRIACYLCRAVRVGLDTGLAGGLWILYGELGLEELSWRFSL